MLGPLPPLHRVTVCCLALLACVGLGAWAAWTLPVPVLAHAGAVAGAALGLVMVALVLHQPADAPVRRRAPGRRRPLG